MSPNFPFDVIFFDIGGVLLTNGWDQKERSVVIPQFRLSAAELEMRHNRIFKSWERGEIDLREYLDTVVFYEPRPFTREDFYAAMCAQSKELPNGALSILRELAASHKCRVGSLNNEAPETNEFRFQKFGLRALFEFAFSSCYLGIRKPDPAIYQRVLAILGVPAGRTLFIDDRAENIEGAASVGMRTIHFTGADALQAELKTMGVL